MRRRARAVQLRALAALVPIVLATLGALAAAGCGNKHGSSNTLGEAPRSIPDDVPSVYQALQAYYLYPQNIPANPSQFATVSSLVAALNDPFTFVLTPPQAAAATQGSFQGVFGLGIAPLGTFVYVCSIDPSGPAWAAGLRRNDIVETIDGVALTSTSTTTDLVNALAPSTIKVHALRGPRTQLDVTMTRATFTTTAVEDEAIDARTHYVRIGAFVNGSTNPLGPAGELLTILQNNPAPTRWVIDLRWNTGGYLTQAAAIADLFISSGRILSLRDRTGAVVESYDAAGNAPGAGLSLVVLVNGDSASASEVLADSLRVLRGVRLVGTQTFGKGVSQRVFTFPDGGELRMVSFLMVDANGFNWHGVGLAPDANVSLDPVQLEGGVDSQLAAAIATLP